MHLRKSKTGNMLKGGNRLMHRRISLSYKIEIAKPS